MIPARTDVTVTPFAGLGPELVLAAVEAVALVPDGRLVNHGAIGVLLDQTYSGEGVQVAGQDQNGQPPVSADGPADRAGIHPGDIILAIDGRPVTEPDELIVAIRALTPGDTVLLRVRTGSAERDVRVKLDESSAP